MSTQLVHFVAREDVADVLASPEWKDANMSSLDGQLKRVRKISSSGYPPMKVITASQLQKLKRLPRSSDGLAVDLESLLLQHRGESDKSTVVVVFFSHRWFRPSAQVRHPDDAAGHKAMAMVQFAKWLMWMQKASDPNRANIDRPKTCGEACNKTKNEIAADFRMTTDVDNELSNKQFEV